MRRAGFLYGRKATVAKKPRDFRLHIDAQGMITPTCWQLDAFALPLLCKFLDTPAEENLVFYMWGHGYELDYGPPRGNERHLEEIFSLVSEAKDVEFVTNGELLLALGFGRGEGETGR